MNGEALRNGRCRFIGNRIYGVREAADLIGVSMQKIRAWIDGWRRHILALIDNDLGWVDYRLAFSFANLMELRFVAFFTDAGVTLAEIRSIMDEVRTEIGVLIRLQQIGCLKQMGKRSSPKSLVRMAFLTFMIFGQKTSSLAPSFTNR